jgi:hypothetical protein
MASWTDVRCRNCREWFPVPAHQDGMPAVAVDVRICASCKQPRQRMNRRQRLRSHICCKLMIWAVKVDDKEAYKLAYGLGQFWEPERKPLDKSHRNTAAQTN